MAVDVNGTRHHVLVGADDWTRRCREVAGSALRRIGARGSLEWDPHASVLHLEERVFRFPPSRGGTVATLDARRGVWATGLRGVAVVSGTRTGVGAQRLSGVAAVPVWPPATPPPAPAGPGDFAACAPGTPDVPPALHGLAVVDGMLVAGVPEAHALLVAHPATGHRELVRWPAGIPFAPWDLAARPGGGVVVADRVNRRLWTLHAGLGVMSAAAAHPPPPGGFRAVDPARRAPAGPSGAGPSGVEDAHALAGPPVAVDVLPDDTVVVLVEDPEGRPLLEVLRRGAPVPEAPGPIPVEDPDRDLVDLRLQDMTVLPAAPGEDRWGTVIVADAGGDQAYRLALVAEDGRLVLRADPLFLPMRLYGGRGLVRVGDAVLYDSDGRFVPLACRARPRYAPRARLVTPVMDAGEAGVAWHRVLLDAAVPEGTAVRMRVRVTDDPAARAGWAADARVDWLGGWALPPPYPRSLPSDAPFADRLPEGVATWETLFQGVRGRFLQLRIDVLGDTATAEDRGDATRSPRLLALRVAEPRFSYPERYLPAVLATRDPDDAAPGEADPFLERFLAGLEPLVTELEGRMRDVRALFDPRTAPPEVLPWLATWVELALDPAWDERRRRLVLRNLPVLYGWRGTPFGVRLAVRLALDPCVDARVFTDPHDPATRAVRIVEHAFAALPALWRPADGAASLVDRLARALAAAGRPALPAFPLTPPADPADRAVWDEVCDDAFGAPLSAGPADAAAWHVFLRGRHGGVPALNAAYDRGGPVAYPSIEAVAVPAVLPEHPAELDDWWAFETRMRARRRAHRFSVLVPVSLTADPPTGEEARLLRDRVRAAIASQTPAHTLAEVRLYWSAFTLGRARLDDDAVLAGWDGARALLGTALLGAAEAGAELLGGTPPAVAQDPGTWALAPLVP